MSNKNNARRTAVEVAFNKVDVSKSIGPYLKSFSYLDNEEDGLTARLDSDYAKLQVANGMKALRSGRVNATANTEADLNITGLEAEKT